MTIISRMSEFAIPPKRYQAARDSAAVPSALARVIAFRDKLLDAVAPFGYEDESGFHYGQPPVPEKVAD